MKNSFFFCNKLFNKILVSFVCNSYSEKEFLKNRKFIIYKIPQVTQELLYFLLITFSMEESDTLLITKHKNKKVKIAQEKSKFSVTLLLFISCLCATFFSFLKKFSTAWKFYGLGFIENICLSPRLN